MANARPTERVERSDGDAGILYVALGRPHLMMALHSARSARVADPWLGISIVTNLVLPPEVAIPEYRHASDHLVRVSGETATNRIFKVSAASRTPYANTLLLDADTVVLRSLDSAFRMLAFVDVLIKLDPKGQLRPWQSDEDILGLGRLGDLPAWNSGAIFFRQGPGSADLFRRWEVDFVQRGSRFDQPSLSVATLTSVARIHPLDERWNCPTSRFAKLGGKSGPANVLHYMSNVPDAVAQSVVAIDEELVKRRMLPPSSETRDFLAQRVHAQEEPSRSRGFLRRTRRIAQAGQL